MKKITLIAAVSCLALCACDTLNSISMPSMGLSNSKTATSENSLESIEEQAQRNMQTVPTATPMVNNTSSALETELSEMEKLTGIRLQAARPATPAASELPVTEESQQADLPIEALEQEQVTEISPEVPDAPTESAVKAETAPETRVVEPVVENIELIEKAETPTAPVMIEKTEDVPELAVEPITETVTATQTIEVVETQPQPTQIQTAEIQETPEPVMIETPKAVAPMAAEATPIFTESDLKLSSAKGCPNIQIMPAARSITNFENDDVTGQMTARASISEIRGGCEIVSGGMELDLDILMKGTITNKGRFEGNVNEEAFITFPYFVSVTTPQGLPVDKQILATAMRFRPSVDYLDHAEKITQFIPMPNVAQAANYTITVGYQLTRKQLDYNRAVAAARPNDQRASPDTIPAQRLSVNPLAE